MGSWNDMGWPARITLLIFLAPVMAAVLYAARPTPRRLAIIKALSVASLAAGIGATAFGVTALLRNVGQRPSLSNDDWPWIAIGFGERLVTSSVSLGCLTITWLLAAVGATRAKDGNVSSTGG